MPTITQTVNTNAKWTGTVPPDATATKFRLYQAPADLVQSYQMVDEILNATTVVADEDLGAGDGVRTAFQTAVSPIVPSSLALHVGTIGGTLLVQGTDYTVTSTGAITLTGSGVTALGTSDLHGAYTGFGTQTFGPLVYGAGGLFVVQPSRPFFLKCTTVRGGVETELAGETALKVVPSAIIGWTLGQMLEQGMRPMLVVGLDPVSGLYYPLNVVPDVAHGGFKLKVDNT